MSKMKNKFTFYEVLVMISCGFFLLFGLVWLIVSMVNGGGFNPWAFLVTGVFGAQLYFRHRVSNLILGILALFFSIWFLLEVINTYDLMAKNATYDGLTKGFIWFCSISIVMSVILVFGYTKLSFKDR